MTFHIESRIERMQWLYERLLRLGMEAEAIAAKSEHDYLEEELRFEEKRSSEAEDAYAEAQEALWREGEQEHAEALAGAGRENEGVSE